MCPETVEVLNGERYDSQLGLAGHSFETVSRKGGSCNRKSRRFKNQLRIQINVSKRREPRISPQTYVSIVSLSGLVGEVIVALDRARVTGTVIGTSGEHAVLSAARVGALVFALLPSPAPFDAKFSCSDNSQEDSSA